MQDCSVMKTGMRTARASRKWGVEVGWRAVEAQVVRAECRVEVVMGPGGGMIARMRALVEFVNVEEGMVVVVVVVVVVMAPRVGG